jgi:phosphoglycolate phosphatase
MDPLSDQLVSSYVGNGAPTLIRRALGPGASDELIARGLEYFLRYYTEHMLDKTALYPGVQQALDELQAAHVPMAVLTNKPTANSHAIVQGLALAPYFFRVYGGDSFAVKKPDPVGINSLMLETKSTPATTLMVGDSQVDIKTARNAGVQACGVTFGLQPESLITEPPDILIGDMRELIPHVLKH